MAAIIKSIFGKKKKTTARSIERAGFEAESGQVTPLATVNQTILSWTSKFQDIEQNKWPRLRSLESDARNLISQLQNSKSLLDEFVSRVGVEPFVNLMFRLLHGSTSVNVQNFLKRILECLILFVQAKTGIQSLINCQIVPSSEYITAEQQEEKNTERNDEPTSGIEVLFLLLTKSELFIRLSVKLLGYVCAHSFDGLAQIWQKQCFPRWQDRLLSPFLAGVIEKEFENETLLEIMIFVSNAVKHWPQLDERIAARQQLSRKLNALWFEEVMVILQTQIEGFQNSGAIERRQLVEKIQETLISYQKGEIKDLNECFEKRFKPIRESKISTAVLVVPWASNITALPCMVDGVAHPANHPATTNLVRACMDEEKLKSWLFIGSDEYGLIAKRRSLQQNPQGFVFKEEDQTEYYIVFGSTEEHLIFFVSRAPLWISLRKACRRACATIQQHTESEPLIDQSASCLFTRKKFERNVRKLVEIVATQLPAELVNVPASKWLGKEVLPSPEVDWESVLSVDPYVLLRCWMAVIMECKCLAVGEGLESAWLVLQTLEAVRSFLLPCHPFMSDYFPRFHWSCSKHFQHMNFLVAGGIIDSGCEHAMQKLSNSGNAVLVIDVDKKLGDQRMKFQDTSRSNTATETKFTLIKSPKLTLGVQLCKVLIQALKEARQTFEETAARLSENDHREVSDKETAIVKLQDIYRAAVLQFLFYSPCWSAEAKPNQRSESGCFVRCEVVEVWKEPSEVCKMYHETKQFSYFKNWMCGTSVDLMRAKAEFPPQQLFDIQYPVSSTSLQNRASGSEVFASVLGADKNGLFIVTHGSSKFKNEEVTTRILRSGSFNVKSKSFKSASQDFEISMSFKSRRGSIFVTEVPDSKGDKLSLEVYSITLTVGAFDIGPVMRLLEAHRLQMDTNLHSPIVVSPRRPAEIRGAGAFFEYSLCRSFQSGLDRLLKRCQDMITRESEAESEPELCMREWVVETLKVSTRPPRLYDQAGLLSWVGKFFAVPSEDSLPKLNLRSTALEEFARLYLEEVVPLAQTVQRNYELVAPKAFAATQCAVELQKFSSTVLDQISKHHNIAVVGSRGTGKTSLINALIGQNLLPVDYSKETSKVIELCFSEDLELHCSTGSRTFTNDASGRQELKAELTNETMVEKRLVGKRGKFRRGGQVRLGLPCEILRAGVRLLDSPGLDDEGVCNYLSSHFKEKLCGGFIVLVDACNGGLTSTVQRLLTTLGEENKLFDCANILFVVTHLDYKLTIAEKDRMLKKIEGLLTEVFEGCTVCEADFDAFNKALESNLCHPNYPRFLRTVLTFLQKNLNRVAKTATREGVFQLQQLTRCLHAHNLFMRQYGMSGKEREYKKQSEQAWKNMQNLARDYQKKAGTVIKDFFADETNFSSILEEWNQTLTSFFVSLPQEKKLDFSSFEESQGDEVKKAKAARLIHTIFCRIFQLVREEGILLVGNSKELIALGDQFKQELISIFRKQRQSIQTQRDLEDMVGRIEKLLELKRGRERELNDEFDETLSPSQSGNFFTNFTSLFGLKGDTLAESIAVLKRDPALFCQIVVVACLESCGSFLPTASLDGDVSSRQSWPRASRVIGSRSLFSKIVSELSSYIHKVHCAAFSCVDFGQLVEGLYQQNYSALEGKNYPWDSKSGSLTKFIEALEEKQNDLLHFEYARTKEVPSIDEVIQEGTLRKLSASSSGGFGLVFEGKHKKSQEIVCIKRVRKTPQCWFEFHREEQALEELRHPNIIGFFGCVVFQKATSRLDMIQDHENVELGIITELAPHSDLRNTLESTEVFAPDEPLNLEMAIANCVGQIAHVMKYISEKIYVYRDLKPENILVFPTAGGYEYKLCDFGNARGMFERDTDVSGSPGYMAPELGHTESAFQADQWSFGIVLHELFFSRRPDSNAGTRKIFQDVERSPMPNWIRKLLKMCLIEDHTKRASWEQIISIVHSRLKEFPCGEEERPKISPLAKGEHNRLTFRPATNVSAVSGYTKYNQRLYNNN